MFADQLVRQIVIDSARVRDRSGSGVGTTLGELRSRYPNGALFVGFEGDGGHANFASGSKAIFRLDRKAIPAACFESQQAQNCVGSDVKVESVLLDGSAN